MLDSEIKALSKVRLELSQDCLNAAKQLFSVKSYRSAANRSYYAAFHAMRAVLALDEIDMKRHSGIISEFRRRYIRTGIFDSKFSDIISELFNARTDSDYDDFFIISKSDTERQIADAELFVNAVSDYLNKLSD